MSRIAEWKLEKIKVKVVFRLQFHATHIPQTGWDKLFISFIPADSGKATAKTTKANVRNGTCKWADPIYETTRLLQDAKSKQYDEKPYKFVVAMGSSRSGILGEASINLADYADALKPSSIALPLHGCNFETILHVTVQLLTSKTGFREFEQQRELRERRLQMGTDLRRHDGSSTGKLSTLGETTSHHMDKDNARIRSKAKSKDLPSLEEEVGLTDEYADSATGFDGSSNTSESLYAENNETSSTHEIDCLKSTISGDINGCPHCQSPQTGKRDPSDHRISAQTSNDWVRSSDYSTHIDFASGCEEGSRLAGSLEVAESCVYKLKQEVSSLQSHADEIGVEAHKFSQQLAAEIASGEELVKEVSVLKSECSKFRDDLEQLKDLNLSLPSASRCINCTDKDHLFQNIQLRWLQGISVVEDKIRELHNKAFLGFHETDFGFLHSDLGSLLSFLQNLKRGDGAISLLNVVPSVRPNVKEIREASVVEGKQFLSGTGFDVDLYQPEGMLSCLSMPDFMSQNPDSIDAANVMRGKIFELLRELDDAKAEKESLVRKMDQMECYYEALIQEHEENQKQMLGELQNLKNEHSTCLYTIACNKAEMESMHQNINEQILRFTEERRALDSFNKELERRANVSEAALRRARLNYSIAVNQLQKDLDLLSFQVLSMFETNENLVKQTFSETSQPCFQRFPDTEQNQQEPLQDQNQNARLKKQFLGGDSLFEDLKKSLYLQEERFQKVEEELCEMHLVNVHLDIFSRALQETLLEATADIMLMKDKIHELAQQLKFSTESKESLMVRLRAAMDDVQMLNEDKASCIGKCSDMALQNQILEAKLKSVYNENGVLTQKVTELEELMKEYRSYRSKYEACSLGKMEQANLLKKETLRNGHLEKEISSLKEELATVKDEYNELASSKENLQKIVSHLQDKLGSLLASYSEQFNELSLPSKSPSQDLEFKDFTGVTMQLEEIQHTACGKILQLMEEKKSLEAERKAAQVSLSSTNSEILMMKQKFKHDVQDMVTKLDLSNSLVENLQLELEAIGNKVHVSSEAEEKFAQQKKELFADFALLELELQQLISKNGELAQKILDLDNVTEELGRSRLTIAALIQEKQDLMTTLQEKTEEHVILSSELDKLKENLRFLYDDLQGERSFRNKLEGKVTNLTFQLNESHEQLLHFAQQKTELAHFRQLVSDLELEKSQVFNLLLQREEGLEKLHEESSYVKELGCQLSEVHEYLLSADIENAFIRSQYETRIEELSQQHQSSDWHLENLRKQHIDVETMLNRCLASEVHYTEENAKLVTNVESLKSELEDSIALNSVLSDSNSGIMAQLEEYKDKVAILGVNFCKDKNQNALHVDELKNMLVHSEEEISELMSSKEELEIIVIVLKAKLDEQLARMTSLEEYNDGLMTLQDQCNELTHKLGEQILKTEEFKNLSIHLKELKDKADAECLQTREKQETEVPTVAVQESLRIAFIREQYETKMQELRHRLSISKKHGEEMLLKLQDAVDEVENRRKSEASHLKRNEELSRKVLELEAELNLVVSEKREKIKAYDRTKAELECTLLSLECCKEEKQKLKASFQESKEEKSRIAAELVSTKELLESSGSAINIPKEENGGSNKLGHMPGQPVVGRSYPENTVVDTPGLERVNTNAAGTDSTGNCLNQDSLINNEEEEYTSSSPRGESEPSSALMSVQAIGDVLVSKRVHEVQEHPLPDQVTFPHNGSKHLTVTNNVLKSQDLKSSLDHLHEELEKMKNQNSLLQYDHLFDSEFENLQGELIQLNKANEDLRSMFPFFNEFSGTGNALERVFALEIELAEALRAKKKPSSHFQSSFLKQHSDEVAVLQSFRDINELIKDMLELKGRYAAKDGELKDMHDRYSQLSLQFAEVEGDRQKLMMTLKNIRASKKLPYLNHSSANHPS